MSGVIDDVTHDSEADAAYIRLVDLTESRQITTHVLEDRPIHLDFDGERQLVGIEVLDASSYLPEELLDRATKLE